MQNGNSVSASTGGVYSDNHADLILHGVSRDGTLQCALVSRQSRLPKMPRLTRS